MQVSTVVGYNNITLRSGGLASGSSFSMVATDGMRITDLVPTGYKQFDHWLNGSGLGFKNLVSIEIVDANGRVASNVVAGVRKQLKWQWTHTVTGTKPNKTWVGDGYWHWSGETAAIEKGSEQDYEFNDGEGILVRVQASAYSPAPLKQEGIQPDSYKLLNSGEVLQVPQTLALRSGGLYMVVPVTRDVNLTELTPTGYKQFDHWLNGSGLGFKNLVSIEIVDANGRVASNVVAGVSKQLKWQWTHTVTGTKPNKTWVGDGYWHWSGETAAIEKGSAQDYPIKMGQGILVRVQASAYSPAPLKQEGIQPDSYKLSFPGLDKDDDEE